jgi:hypothetical protein
VYRQAMDGKCRRILSPPCQDELVPAFLETLCTRGAGKDGTTWRPRLATA